MLWRGPSFAPGPPILSGGLVWTVDRGGTLHALNPTSGNEVFQAYLGTPVTHFPSLASANGRLVVPAGAAVTTFLLSANPAVPAVRAGAACPTSTLSGSHQAVGAPGHAPSRGTGHVASTPHAIPGSRTSIPLNPLCIARH